MGSEDFLKTHLNAFFLPSKRRIQVIQPSCCCIACAVRVKRGAPHRDVQSVPLQVFSTGAVLVTDWIFLVSVPPLLSQESEEILADTFPALCVVLLFFFLFILSVNPLLCPLKKP